MNIEYVVVVAGIGRIMILFKKRSKKRKMMSR